MSDGKKSDMQIHMAAALMMARLDLERFIEKSPANTSPTQIFRAHLAGLREALSALTTFQQGVELGAFRAETILHGYMLLAREAGVDPTVGSVASASTYERLTRFISDQRDKEESSEAPTVAPWSALAVRFLCNEIDRLLPPPPAPPKCTCDELHLRRLGHAADCPRHGIT